MDTFDHVSTLDTTALLSDMYERQRRMERQIDAIESSLIFIRGALVKEGLLPPSSVSDGDDDDDDDDDTSASMDAQPMNLSGLLLAEFGTKSVDD